MWRAPRPHHGALRRQFERYADEAPEFNGFILTHLLDLRALELKDLMEAALTSGHVEESIAGDWEDVQIKLGLKTERAYPGKYNLFHPTQTSAPSRGKRCSSPSAPRSLMPGTIGSRFFMAWRQRLAAFLVALIKFPCLNVHLRVHGDKPS